MYSLENHALDVTGNSSQGFKVVTIRATSFNIQKLCILPAQYIYVFHMTYDKQGLFP
jgi:hypothetical protein